MRRRGIDRLWRGGDPTAPSAGPFEEPRDLSAYRPLVARPHIRRALSVSAPSVGLRLALFLGACALALSTGGGTLAALPAGSVQIPPTPGRAAVSPAARSAAPLADRSEAEDSQEECTIAVVSGSATPDGRPLLWKNRDTGFINNEIVWFDDGNWPYLALVSAGDSINAWVGVNAAGFAVMNALSHNIPDNYSGGITNGQLMKLALRICATVEDFDSLLVATNETGRQNPANLGVIDAAGGAAMFEVGNFSFVRFDADASKGTEGGRNPSAFIVRANFSLSADTTSVDTWRFRRASQLVGAAALGAGVRVPDLVRAARDLRSVTLDPYPLPYTGTPPGYPDDPGYILTYETINRQTTAGGGVIEGVRPGEDPLLSTFYSFLGQPVLAPALPLWVAAGPTPPEIDGEETAPFCDRALELRAAVYDRPYNSALLDTRALVRSVSGSPEFLPLVQSIERDAFPQAEASLRDWRARGVHPLEMAETERRIAAEAFARYGGAGGGDLVATRLEPGFRISPNPLRPGQTALIEPLGPLETSLVLDVFDVHGRRVASVAGPSGGSGDTPALAWDGRGADGRRLPSGVYYCRAQGARPGPARTLVIVR